MTAITEKVSIAILAGGESRRMGQDKAALIYRGMPLLEHVAAEARSVAADILVVGRERPDDWPFDGVRFAVDERPGRGPLGGLYTALRNARCERVLLLACDLPRVRASDLRWILDRDEAVGGEDGLAIEFDGRAEPLCSVYARALLPAVERRLAGERRSLQGLIAEGRFGRVVASPEIGEALRGVNTPEEFQSLCPPEEVSVRKP